MTHETEYEAMQIEKYLKESIIGASPSANHQHY
jgi:hypothetical protein